MLVMTDSTFDRRRIPDDATITRWTAGDGWDLRSFRWPVAGTARGTVLFMGGRGDFFEKYLETFAHFHRLGWRVESLDWRGQGGSGRLGARSDVGHTTRFADWTRDLADYATELKARAPGPIVVIGHSMGGHLVLRALAEGALPVAAAVLVAPMLGFADSLPQWMGRVVAHIAAKIVGTEQRMWKVSEKPFSPLDKRMGLLTHSRERYADEQYFWDTRPELKLGPASWGWIAAAYDSFAWLAKPGRIEAITTPVLILSASADGLVSPPATRAMAARLPHARLVEFGDDAAHELLRESDAVRDSALAAIDALLDETVPSATVGASTEA